MRLYSTFHTFLALCLSVLILAGCNTIGGVGRDISAVGGAITGASGGAERGIARAMSDSAATAAAVSGDASGRPVAASSDF
jgi:predicted small secreted protein